MAVITTLSNLSPKQKALIERLKANGTPFKLTKRNGKPFIEIDNRKQKWTGDYLSDYEEDEYMITNFDLAAGEWGD